MLEPSIFFDRKRGSENRSHLRELDQYKKEDKLDNHKRNDAFIDVRGFDLWWGYAFQIE